nr:DUF4910 domain-containing protein [Haliscomenobacter sp.]
MANDNLSGISLLTLLAQCIVGAKKIAIPTGFVHSGTIGSITWLALNEPQVQNIKHGLVASLLGDGGRFTYKKEPTGQC